MLGCNISKRWQSQGGSLSGTTVTDAGLRYLKGTGKLETLKINGTKVTTQGVKKLQEALPNCQIEWQFEWEPPSKVNSRDRPQEHSKGLTAVLLI